VVDDQLGLVGAPDQVEADWALRVRWVEDEHVASPAFRYAVEYVTGQVALRVDQHESVARCHQLTGQPKQQRALAGTGRGADVEPSARLVERDGYRAVRAGHRRVPEDEARAWDRRNGRELAGSRERESWQQGALKRQADQGRQLVCGEQRRALVGQRLPDHPSRDEPAGEHSSGKPCLAGIERMEGAEGASHELSDSVPIPRRNPDPERDSEVRLRLAIRGCLGLRPAATEELGECLLKRSPDRGNGGLDDDGLAIAQRLETGEHADVRGTWALRSQAPGTQAAKLAREPRLAFGSRAAFVHAETRQRGLEPGDDEFRPRRRDAEHVLDPLGSGDVLKDHRGAPEESPPPRG
jgi:hypothetical protein